MGCLVTFLLSGGWVCEFHYRSLLNFNTDLHASLDAHKERGSAGSGDELFLVFARESNSFIAFFFFSSLTTIRNQFSPR